MPTFANILPGDPAPWFQQRSFANPRYNFDSAAGRYIVLCLFGSAGMPQAQAAIETAKQRPDFFNDNTAAFFGVSVDPADEAEGRVKDSYPGYRYFWDFDLSVSKLYGAVDVDVKPGDAVAIRPAWIVLDPTLRVIASIPFANDGSDRSKLLEVIDGLPPPTHFAGFQVHPPIIILPNVFERELCDRLIDLYEANGGEESGFMREVDGKTQAVHDHGYKRRKDYMIEDQPLIQELQGRFMRRVIPEIQKVHQFKVTRMERYLVGCYAAEDSAHFNAHRDNTTKGTAHRRFAVSVNLNSDFDGGEVSFPEYSPKGFKAPPGGAVVFSCSLLHAVSTVTRGRRFAFLPFLYDDEAARIREANNQFLAEGVAAYKS